MSEENELQKVMGFSGFGGGKSFPHSLAMLIEKLIMTLVTCSSPTYLISILHVA